MKFSSSDVVTGTQRPAIALAAMGDSNSHSYQDRISFAPGSANRGGTYRPQTLQWTEVLARLRGQQIDEGPWVAWGVSNPWLRWLDVAGVPVGRAPRKEDYRYNFANDGAQCEQLMGTRVRQAPRLLALMNESPERWRQGVVVIRFGSADLEDRFDAQARNPDDPEVAQVLQHCLQRIGEAVALIHSAHPATHIVLVGLFNEADDPGNLARWHSAAAIANTERLCDRFDEGLRRIAAAYQGVSVFDERAWFHLHWGARDANGGTSTYKSVAIGSHLRVGATRGDAPTNAVLADDHNGLVWNVLWAQALTVHLNTVAKLPVTPISDEEVTRFVEGLLRSE